MEALRPTSGPKPPPAQTVPADGGSETEQDTDDEWHGKVLATGKHLASKKEEGAVAPNAGSRRAAAIVVHDSDSDDSNSGLIPSRRPRSLMASRTSGKGKAKETVQTLAIQSQPTLSTLPNRAQLEVERLERQQKRALTAAGADIAQPAAKRARITPTSSSSNPMAARRFESGILLPTPTIQESPRKDGREVITFEELLGVNSKTPDTTLELAVIAAFGTDPNWLMQFFPSDVPVICGMATGEEERGPTTSRPYQNQNWVQTSPHMKARACMHMKYLVLMYKSGRLRVVISTGNLIEQDWTILENAVFIQDVYLKSSNRVGDGSTASSQGHSATDDSFVKILENVLEVTNVAPALKAVREKHPLSRLSTLSDLSTLWDWTHVHAELVASIPGKYQGWKQIRKTGHPRLMCAVEALGLGVSSGSSKTPALSLECGGSSIPAFTTQWVNQFYVSALGNRSALRGHLSLPENKRKQAPYPSGVKVIFPSKRRVLEAGARGGGSLFCTRKKWEAKNFPRNAFYECQSRAGNALMHTKMVVATFSESTRRSSGAADAAGWMYVGSHNFTSAAWGNLSGTEDAPVLNVNNFELGVVLPLQTPQDIETMCAWERPPKKYRGDDVPWFLDEARTLLGQ
ncbi:hypothetical protein HMN09_01349600 [Mycena chlorophos]|uniref:Phospholipase D/nuclease n=1 Tax=Mycena chlorophos TaxID=658473 RepID=A0A8H6RZC2_MYCCL|nr:hypothetical protein HMN09_01349600 [Mycena chlorophos]